MSHGACKELLCCLVLVGVSHVAGEGQVICLANIYCTGGSGDNLGMTVDGERCCLDNPTALAFIPPAGEACIRCVVVGFFNATYSGIEQGPSHSVPVGYIKGGEVAYIHENLVFNVISTPGTAREGSQFDYTVNTARVRASSSGAIGNVVLTFRVDAVAQEPKETFTLTLDPLAFVPPRGFFFRNTIDVTIVDSDTVEFAFTEDDFRANEPNVGGPPTFLPVAVTKSTRIASRVELVVVPLTVPEAQATSTPLPPNIPNDNVYFPPFASLSDFNHTNITVVFEPDEDHSVAVSERSVPILIVGDDINEATEQVFVVDLILISTLDAATVDLTTRPSALCRIIDNDPIRIGFELPGYTYTEPSFDEVIDESFTSATGQPENGPIFLVKEDNVTSEQTFLISIQVSDSAPLGIQPATSGQDYRTSTSVHNVFFHPFAQRIPFAFTLLADALFEGTEAFQASVSPEDTRDIGGGMHERFPTSLHPISLESNVFITIEDDVSDSITIGFADTSYTVSESVGTFQVGVQVFNPRDDQPLPLGIYIVLVIQTISGTAIGGSDYQEISAPRLEVLLSFDHFNRRQSFSVTIIDDLIVEDAESFTLQLRFDPYELLPPSSVRLSPNVSVVTILDDDDPASTTVPPTTATPSTTEPVPTTSMPRTTQSVPKTAMPPTTEPTTPTTAMPSITVPSLPPPPTGVQGLCSFVVWYSPVVPCEDIRGYEVRLYNPQSPHLQNYIVTDRVGANGTFYMVDEEKLVSSDETYVQVRVIHRIGVGEWSEGTSLGCEKPIAPEKPTAPERPPRVHFELNGKVYLNNSALPLIDVGEGTSALYCKTDKEECCGTVPNRFGQFYYPSGGQVPIGSRQQGFYRNRGDQVIRLNRREGVTSPTGIYQCEIPNADDETVKIYITLTGN